MRYGILLAVGLLSGCSTITPTPVTPAWSDLACAAVARQRQIDAAVNGYDDDGLQARIGRDAYASCLDQNRMVREIRN